MKNCPFCAEEIQDAAIVCKHCGCDLVVAIAQPPPKATPRWGRILIVVGVVLAVGFWALSSIARDRRVSDVTSTTVTPAPLVPNEIPKALSATLARYGVPDEDYSSEQNCRGPRWSSGR
jgi:hypothetical protein